MWTNTNLVLEGANQRMWYWDHTGWSWIFGLHGLFWLLMAALIVVILVVSFRLAIRDTRSAADAADRGRQRRTTDRN